MTKHHNIQQSNSPKIITKQSDLGYLQHIQENKLAIVINLRSYNKRKLENPLPLTTNEAIPQQGK